MQTAFSLHLDLALVDDVHGAEAADLRPGHARLGARRVGPLGLARALAPHVGVPWRTASPGERVVAADRVLGEADDGRAWFSDAREADRFGVARWLVHAHDALRRLGWDGRALAGAPRLDTVAALRRGDGPPGDVDRAHEVIEAVRAGALRVPVGVRVEAPESTLPTFARRLVDALRLAGHDVAVVHDATPRADDASDLGRLQRALAGADRATLTGDGTLLVLEADTPWEAAEATAALLARDGDAACVVATEPALLDEARARHGLPRLGLARASAARPALQVLPLALELQLAPRDPAAALQLLTLPLTPLRGGIRRALIRALREQPGVGGPLWRASAEDALTALAADDAHAAATQRTRLARLAPAEAPAEAEGLEVGAAVAVAEEVARWARSRALTDAPFADELRAAAGAATDLLRLLARLPQHRRLDRIELRHLHELVAAEGRGETDRAEVGAPPCSAAPAGLPPTCDAVLWWGAVAGAAEEGAALAWTAEETAVLAAADVALPPPGALRSAEQDAWLRPLRAARRRAVIVRWKSAGAEAAEPHPLLDAVHAAVADGIAACTRSARALRQGELGDAVAPDPAWAPRGAWRVPEGLVTFDRALSATQIDRLLSCPLRWALSYGAGMHPGGVDALPALRTMLGTFAHALLQDEVLYPEDTAFDALTPEQARARVFAAFDARVGAEAVPLLLPGQGALLARARRDVADGAAALVRALKAGGWVPVLKAEEKVKGTFAGHPFEGRIDLVVRDAAGRLAVVDLKIGGSSYGRKLREGQAVQIALYARGLGGDASAGAYFLVEEGRLLTTDGAAFPDATVVEGPSLGQTLLDAERAWAWWERALGAGVAVALGEHVDEGGVEAAEEAAGEPPPEGPWAKADPPCRWCDQRRICSFALGGAA